MTFMAADESAPIRGTQSTQPSLRRRSQDAFVRGVVGLHLDRSRWRVGKVVVEQSPHHRVAHLPVREKKTLLQRGLVGESQSARDAGAANVPWVAMDLDARELLVLEADTGERTGELRCVT